MMQQRFTPHRNFRKKFSPNKHDNDKLIRAIRSVQIISRQKSRANDTEEYIAHHSFENFFLSETLRKNIAYKGYTTPTPIQDQSIAHILSGRDIIGIANTGTGKTAAFLIPLIQKITLNKTEKVLIITPTRELAAQISEELRDFARGLGISAVLCIGGTSLGKQKNELRRNPHVVIGTPGRIKDLIQQNSLSLSQFSAVVLDEADRMVDIGFIADIKYFISLLPRKRQSLFFSATISGKVHEVLQAFVQDPITVSVKKQDTVENIQQNIVQVLGKQKKVEQLHDLLIQKGYDKVLIFGRTKWGIQKLTDELNKRGFKAGAIHGNKRQSQRQKTLEQFKTDQIKILLATDIASRGLDIEDVSHVINYDLPASYNDYIHRIGRTGRANKRGIALTFIE